MAIRFRVLLYVAVSIAYFYLPFGFIWLGAFLGIDDYYVSVGIGFSIMDLIVLFLLLDINTVYRAVIAVALSFLSLWLAFRIGDSEPFPSYDPYGIVATVVSNIALSILGMETMYQVGLRYKRQD